MAEQAPPNRPFDGLKDVIPKHRRTLIDWLFQVAIRFNLFLDVWCLAVTLLDRAIPKLNPARSRLQLVGLACVMIAAKYIEMFPPEVGDYKWISDNAYTINQIVQMEATVFAAVDFSIGAPTVMRYIQPEGAPTPQFYLAQLLAFLSHMSYNVTEATALERTTAARELAERLTEGGVDEAECAPLQKHILLELGKQLGPKPEQKAIADFFKSRRQLAVAHKLSRSDGGYWTFTT